MQRVTVSATGRSATSDYLSSLNEERRQKCYENIFKVEDAGRLVYIYKSAIWLVSLLVC